MFAKTIVLYCLIMACSQPARNNKIQQMPSYLYQHWIHLYEEDDATQQHQAYRPATYTFPPARGRDGFEIKENGVFVAYPIAPTDGNLTIEEKWAVHVDELIITGEHTTYGFKIISLTKEKLVLKPISVK